MLLRYEYFVLIPAFFKVVMGCHGDHEFSKTKAHLFLRTKFFWHLRGPIEQIYTHNEMSYAFNPLAYYGLLIVFPSFLRFH